MFSVSTISLRKAFRIAPRKNALSKISRYGRRNYLTAFGLRLLTGRGRRSTSCSVADSLLQIGAFEFRISISASFFPHSGGVGDYRNLVLDLDVFSLIWDCCSLGQHCEAGFVLRTWKAWHWIWICERREPSGDIVKLCFMVATQHCSLARSLEQPL